MTAPSGVRYEIVEARLHHCGQMARLMRTAQREAIARAGYDPHRELRSRFDSSSIRRALLIDGRLAALGGVVGTMLSPHGFVWLVLSEEARRHPLAIVRLARQELASVMGTYRELATLVLEEDRAARRFAIFLGFHVADKGPGAMAYTRRDRRALFALIDESPEILIPVGNARAAAMGYH